MRNPATSAASRILITCLAFAVFQSDALTCYRCTITKATHVGDVDQRCAEFDASSSFYAECPHSTFCMKRIIHSPLNRSFTTAERGCAHQRYTYQDYIPQERRWVSKESVNETAYKEGCFIQEDRGSPNGPSEYCYCSDDYCNKSPRVTNPLQLCSLLVVTIILALRFSTI